MDRVNVIGTTSSGKTTFCRRLAQTLNATYIELDALLWEPNWTEASDEDLFTRVTEAVQAPRWVLDGNYSRTRPITWKNINTVIWLDYSFPRTLWRCISRSIHRAMIQQELWAGTGNRESFRRMFSQQSIVLHMNA